MADPGGDAIEREKLATERYKARLSFLGVVVTALLGGLVVGWINADYQDRQKASALAAEERQKAAAQAAEDARVAIERIRAESQVRTEEMKALGQFAEAAMGDQLAKRIRFAEYFAMMTLTAEMRQRWNDYYASLVGVARDLDRLEAELFEAQRGGDRAATDRLTRQIARLVNYTARIDPPSRVAANAASLALPASPAPADTRPPADCRGLKAAEIAALTTFHRRFPGSVEWRLAPGGLEVRDGPDDPQPDLVASRVPAQTRRILQEAGPALFDAARAQGVPAELLLATAWTETGGRFDAMRQEPGYVSDEATPQRVSGGPSGLLLSTLREVLGDPGLGRADLLDPAKAMRGLAAYLQRQRSLTGFDPPLVAAAYQAGALYFQDGPTNRWKLRTYPIGTPQYVDRYLIAFNDALGALRETPPPEGVPSFAACLPEPPR